MQRRCNKKLDIGLGRVIICPRSLLKMSRRMRTINANPVKRKERPSHAQHVILSATAILTARKSTGRKCTNVLVSENCAINRGPAS
mmetsp:Transcript_11235/g.18569  ORF Transcript_11235/g.18569 Transcript_11235/m.18569 type:complete len:86 (+) Transcript_11235:1592-1849(+)